MNSLFSESTIKTLKAIRKWFLWIAVCILIGEVVVGAILILVQSFNETIGKLMGTFALCAIMMFFGVNNFSRMEKGDRIVQSFALISLIGNIVWLILSFLFIWEVIPFIESTGVWYYSYHMTVMAKVFSVAFDIALMCLFVSNVWSIKETVKPVKPLKITALICVLYCGIYSAVVTVGEVQTVEDGRWYALLGLAGLAFVVMTCAAAIVSRSGRKKEEKESNASAGNVNSAEMQAKIQEMVEKEVQERLNAGIAKTEGETTPPSQTNDTTPNVSSEANMNDAQPDNATVDQVGGVNVAQTDNVDAAQPDDANTAQPVSEKLSDGADA